MISVIREPAKQGCGPLDFVIVDDELLLKHLDGIQAATLLLFCQHDLTKVALTEHGQKVEVIQTNFALARRRALLGWLLLLRG